jgi:hypothetical protein
MKFYATRKFLATSSQWLALPLTWSMYFDNEVDQIRSDKCHFLKGPPRAMGGGPCTSPSGMYEGVSLPTPAEVLDGFDGTRFPVTRS